MHFYLPVNFLCLEEAPTKHNKDDLPMEYIYYMARGILPPPLRRLG